MSLTNFKESQLTREELDEITGPLVVIFGTNWCGHCQKLAPVLEKLLCQSADSNSVWIEDGPGRALGRSFQVKLWPTVIFREDGQTLEKLVRPDETSLAKSFQDHFSS